MMVDVNAAANSIPTGLGALGATEDLPVNAGGYTLDCENYIEWTLTPQCWKYSPAAWAQIRQFNRPSVVNVPPAAVPLAYTGQPAYEGSTPAQQHTQYMQETSGVLTTAAAESQARTLAQTQEEANYVPAPNYNDPTSWPAWVWLAVAGGVAYIAYRR